MLIGLRTLFAGFFFTLTFTSKNIEKALKMSVFKAFMLIEPVNRSIVQRRLRRLWQ